MTTDHLLHNRWPLETTIPSRPAFACCMSDVDLESIYLISIFPICIYCINQSINQSINRLIIYSFWWLQCEGMSAATSRGLLKCFSERWKCGKEMLRHALWVCACMHAYMWIVIVNAAGQSVQGLLWSSQWGSHSKELCPHLWVVGRNDCQSSPLSFHVMVMVMVMVMTSIHTFSPLYTYTHTHSHINTQDFGYAQSVSSESLRGFVLNEVISPSTGLSSVIKGFKVWCECECGWGCECECGCGCGCVIHGWMINFFDLIIDSSLDLSLFFHFETLTASLPPPLSLSLDLSFYLFVNQPTTTNQRMILDARDQSQDNSVHIRVQTNHSLERAWCARTKWSLCWCCWEDLGHFQF